MKDVLNKLKFKSNGIVLNAPADLEKRFAIAGCTTSFDPGTKSSNTLVFVNDYKEFINFLSTQLPTIKSDSILWFAYPKGSSGVKTDINRDIMRAAAPEFGITTVAAISINETWSALRFRPTDKVGKK
ncbi:MAG: hypothetical protein WCJ95_15745 [Mariniphaga sp.]